MFDLSCYNGEFRGSLIVLLDISEGFSKGKNPFLDIVNWPF